MQKVTFYLVFEFIFAKRTNKTEAKCLAIFYNYQVKIHTIKTRIYNDLKCSMSPRILIKTKDEQFQYIQSNNILGSFR